MHIGLAEVAFYDATCGKDRNRSIWSAAIPGGDSGNDAAITEKQIVHIVRFKVGVDDRGLRIDPGTAGPA